MSAMNASHSPTTLQHSGLQQSSGYPYVDRLKTTERNPLTMSENTTLEKSEGHNFMGGAGAYPGPGDVEPNDESQTQMMACSYDQPQQEYQNGASVGGQGGNALNQFVTKVPQADLGPADGSDNTSQQNLHQ